MSDREVRLYLTGADGMLGSALMAALREHPVTAAWTVLGVSIADFDIADADAFRRSVDAFRPTVVVHTAAHAVVDDCERQPGLALAVNVGGVHHVAAACRRHGSRLVYISSDYVFDGLRTPDGGYRETDIPNPVSVYGLTKLAGERISSTVVDHLVVRTSWLFGGADERMDNVLATVQQLARGDRPQLIADQLGCPTYTADLAGALVFLLTRPVTGTIHATNAGVASWYDVGGVALTATGPEPPRPGDIVPVSLASRGFLGGRPRNSRLNGDRLAELGHAMPPWSDAVRRFCATLAVPAAACVEGRAQ